MHKYLELKWLECYNFVFLVFHRTVCRHLFVIFKSFWMVFWEHKTELVFFSITDGTEVIINLIEDDGLESEY